jgi:peroxiredoxin Q/BCP
MENKIRLLDKAVDFTLTDTQSSLVKLSDFLEKKNVVLVFNRGFACPFCRRHMEHLRQDYPKFVDHQTEIITIGPGSPKAYQHFWKDQDMPFIGLSDVGSQTTHQYFQEFNLLKFGWVPALFIIDKQGLIRYIHYGKSMADIPEDDAVLKILDDINPIPITK